MIVWYLFRRGFSWRYVSFWYIPKRTATNRIQTFWYKILFLLFIYHLVHHNFFKATLKLYDHFKTVNSLSAFCFWRQCYISNINKSVLHVTLSTHRDYRILIYMNTARHKISRGNFPFRKSAVNSQVLVSFCDL